MPTIRNGRPLSEWLDEKPPVRRAKQSINPEFGKRLQKKRLMIGMSQTALSKHLGVDKKQIRHWEYGLSSPSNRYAEMVDKWLSEPANGILAQRIREKRAELGLTQKELAALLDVSLDSVKAWENQRTFPSSDYLARVIRWLFRSQMRHGKPETQPEFTRFVLTLKERREHLGIGTMTLSLQLGVGKNRVFECEAGRSVPSEVACKKVSNWLDAAWRRCLVKDGAS